MTKEKRTVKSYKTLWNMHIWGYASDKMIFLTSLVFILIGIFMANWGLWWAAFVGGLLMGYHLKMSVYWWRRENRMMDYYMNKTPRQPVMEDKIRDSTRIKEGLEGLN